MEHVYQVPSERRYWVVRADGGDYFSHFGVYGAVAIGHLDEIGLGLTERQENFDPVWSRIYEQFQLHASANEKSSSYATARFNQVRRFVTEIKAGDWVLTVGHNVVRVGRVIGSAIIDPVPMVLRNVDGTEVRMPYQLRRSVVWGRTMSKDRLSGPLLKCLRANQTVFSADNLWEDICHAVLPVFAKGSDLYFTIQIRSEGRIRSIDVSNLLLYLNELELIEKESSAILDGRRSFDALFDEYESGNKLTLTTEAEYHSPGELWGMISGLAPSGMGWGTVFLIGYAMLFGNSKLGFDGLIDIQTRRKIWDLLLERFKSRKMDVTVSRLEVDHPKDEQSSQFLDDQSEKEDKADTDASDGGRK